MINRTHHRSRGFTLVELVTAITLMTILVAVGVGIINVLMKVEQSGRRRMVEASTADVLAHSFRADVRAATKVEPLEAKSGLVASLTLTRPGGSSVSYQVGPTEVKRVEQKEGKEARNIIFRVPKRSSTGFDVHQDRGLTVVSLVYDRESALNAESHSTSFRAEAVLGRDQRFDRVEESK